MSSSIAGPSSSASVSRNVSEATDSSSVGDFDDATNDSASTSDFAVPSVVTAERAGRTSKRVDYSEQDDFETDTKAAAAASKKRGRPRKSVGPEDGPPAKKTKTSVKSGSDIPMPSPEVVCLVSLVSLLSH